MSRAEARLARRLDAAFRDYGSQPDPVTGLTPALSRVVAIEREEDEVARRLGSLRAWVKGRISDAYIEGRISRQEQYRLLASWGHSLPQSLPDDHATDTR
jgi:hypothetical protein